MPPPKVVVPIKQKKKKKRVYNPVKAKEYRTKRDNLQKEAMIAGYRRLREGDGGGGSYDEY